MRAHPWFSGFDWQGLRDGTLPAPYVPAAHRPQSVAAQALSGRLRQSWPSRAPSGGSGSAAMMGGMPPVLEECGPPATSAGGAAPDAGSSPNKGGGGTSAGDSGPGDNSAAVFQPVLRSTAGHTQSGQQTAGNKRYNASSLRGMSPSRASLGALCDEESLPIPPSPQQAWAPAWIRNLTSRAGAAVASFPGGSAAPGPDGPQLCGDSSYDPGASPATSRRPSLSDRSLGSMTCSPGPSSARDARPAEWQPGSVAPQLTPSRSRLSLLGGETTHLRSSYGAAANAPLSGAGALPPRYRPGPVSLPQPPSGHNSESACVTGRTPSAVSSSAVGGSSSIEFNGKGLWRSTGLPVSQGPSQQQQQQPTMSVSAAGGQGGDRGVSVPAALHNAVAGFLLACSPMATAAQRHPDSVAAPGQSTLRDSVGPWVGDAEADAVRRGSVTCDSAPSGAMCAASWNGPTKGTVAAHDLRDSKGRWLERPMAAMDALLALPAQLQDAAVVAAAAMGFAARRPRISPAPMRDVQHSAPASPGGLGSGNSNLASGRSYPNTPAAVPSCGDCPLTADALAAGAGGGATPVADVLDYLSTDQTGSGVVVITRASPCFSSSSAGASPAKQIATAAKQPAATPTDCGSESAFAVAAVEGAVAAAANEASGAITPGSRPLHRPTNSFAFDPASTATGSPQHQQHQMTLMSPTDANHSLLGAGASGGHSRMKSFSFDVASLSVGGNSGSPGVIAGGPLMHGAEGGAVAAHAHRHVPMGAIEEGEPSPASSSSPLMASPAGVQAEVAEKGGGGAAVGLRRRSCRGPLLRRPPWATDDVGAMAADCCGQQQQRLQAADLAPMYGLLMALVLAAYLVRGISLMT